MRLKNSTLLLAAIFATINIQAQELFWAKHFGGTDTDRGLSMKIDTYGNSIIGGVFEGTADFDSSDKKDTLTSNGGVGYWDVFVSKLDKDGNLVWVKQFGGNSEDKLSSLFVDSEGYIYITGSFSGTADFDPSASDFLLTSFGDEDVFVCKLDKDGNLVWAKQFGGTGYDLGKDIAVNSVGDITIIGDFEATADFNPGSGTYKLTPKGGTDVFAVQIDANGNFLWAKQLGGTYGDYSRGICIDRNDNIFLAGNFYATGDFDPSSSILEFTSNGQTDIFITKLNSSGDFIYAKQFGGGDFDNVFDITTDKSNNLIIGGGFSETVFFDTNVSLSVLGSVWYDSFVLKLTNDGDYVWVKQLGGADKDMIYAIATDSADNVYSAGVFEKVFFHGSEAQQLTAVKYFDTFISKISSIGDYEWVSQIGGNFIEQPYSIAVDQNSNVFVTGIFANETDFDPSSKVFNLTAYTNGGPEINDDAFVVKFSQPTTAIHDQTQSSLKFYPNPTSDYIRLSNDNIAASSIYFTDCSGKRVLDFQNKELKSNVDVNVKSLKPGIYFIHVCTDKGVKTGKIVKR